MANMGCVNAEAEHEMKPIDITDLIRKELDLGPCDGMKPKDIVALANSKIGIQLLGGDKTVKEEASHCRGAIRQLPPRFWNPEISVNKNSTPTELVAWLMAKPSSCGGFCGAVACNVINAKSIDTRSVVISGPLDIESMSLLRRRGGFSTIDHECEEISKLFRSEATATKIGDATFHVTQRSQPDKGQNSMLCASTKIHARFASLLTPKWMLIGIYQFTSSPDEAETLALLESLRVEAFSCTPI
jgi:hypothetical protein